MADNQTPQEAPDVRNVEYVDYKDVDLLKRFLNEQGMLMPRRVSGGPGHRRQTGLHRWPERASVMRLTRLF